jgi:HAUS augmin-like complex subunit 4
MCPHNSVLEYSFLRETYTAQTVPALHAIHTEVYAAKAKADREHEAAQNRLNAYQELGLQGTAPLSPENTRELSDAELSGVSFAWQLLLLCNVACSPCYVLISHSVVRHASSMQGSMSW